MKLGSSIRRRRGEEKKGPSLKWLKSLAGTVAGWTVLKNPIFYLAFGLLAVAGFGGGYFYSTDCLVPSAATAG